MPKKESIYLRLKGKQYINLFLMNRKVIRFWFREKVTASLESAQIETDQTNCFIPSYDTQDSFEIDEPISEPMSPFKNLNFSALKSIKSSSFRKKKEKGHIRYWKTEVSSFNAFQNAYFLK